MQNSSDFNAADPLHRLIAQIRNPVTYRELIAACLRSVYMGDPFSDGRQAVPSLPKVLIDEVESTYIQVGQTRCAVYSPKTKPVQTSLILYMHGGGFVLGCSEDTDYVTRKLCHMNHAVVVSINYSLAPEKMFPVAIDECEKVWRYFLQNVGTDFSAIYFAGDSAGANLALALSQRASEFSKVNGLILFAPWLDIEVEKYDSYNRLAPGGIVFDAAFIGYARGSYVQYSQWKDPLVSPIYLAPSSAPPAIVIIGTEDPFLDQAQLFKTNAQAANSQHINFEFYSGMPHGFYLFPKLFDEELHCFDKILQFVSSNA